MKENQTVCHNPLWQSILALSITGLIIVSVLTFQFYYLWNPDFVGKHISATIYFKFYFNQVLVLASLIILFLVIVGVSVYYRQYYRNGGRRFFTEKSIFLAAIIAICSFVWVGFVTPRNNLVSRNLLANIVLSRPGEVISDSIFDRNVSPRTGNYVQLGKAIDSLRNEPQSPYPSLFDMRGENLEMKIERSKMITTGILVFILFFFSMFWGILFRQAGAVLMIICVWLLIFPLIYFFGKWLEKLMLTSKLSIVQAQSLQIATYIIATLILFFIIRKKINIINKIADKDLLD